MKNFRAFLLFSLLIHSLIGRIQDSLITNSATHMFWQPNKELLSENFQGTMSPQLKSYCDTFNLCTVASVGVFSVLDVPKKRKNRGRMLEKVYFAPAFEYATSVYSPNDSMGIKKQQVVYDIYELSTRIARRNLKQIVDSMGVASYGTRYIFFKTLESEAMEIRNQMVDGFTRDVYILNKDSAYFDWKTAVDGQLEKLSDFATTQEEC